MHFTRVAAENFRLFAHLEFEPGPGVNLLLGANAAGKTTVLEAIYALGRGRSFRDVSPEIAGKADAHWRVHGRVAAAGQAALPVGLGWTPEGLDVRIGESAATAQDLVRQIPVQVLEPDSHRLLEEGPVYRRRYLDWGVFHVEHRFFPAWRRYQRALKQRNHALRAGDERAAVEAWNAELVAGGEDIHAFRAAHVEALADPLKDTIGALLGPLDWSLELSRGWAAGKTLTEALADNYEHDHRQGMTVAGPHRAELKLKLDAHAAKHRASRGQQKLLIAALLLTQSRLVAQAIGRAPVLLVDDFPAELGEPFQRALLEALLGYDGQCCVTSLELTPALEILREKGQRNAVFHVEHGVVSRASRV